MISSVEEFKVGTIFKIAGGTLLRMIVNDTIHAHTGSSMYAAINPRNGRITSPWCDSIPNLLKECRDMYDDAEIVYGCTLGTTSKEEEIKLDFTITKRSIRI